MPSKIGRTSGGPVREKKVLKIGKRRSYLMVLATGVVACAFLLFMANRRPPAVVEFINKTGRTMKGVALSCDGIKGPARELADGESAWFKVDESKTKAVRLFYFVEGGHGEILDLIDQLDSAVGSKDVIHISIGRDLSNRSMCISNNLRFGNRWDDFKYQSRIWFYRNF